MENPDIAGVAVELAEGRHVDVAEVVVELAGVVAVMEQLWLVAVRGPAGRFCHPPDP